MKNLYKTEMVIRERANEIFPTKILFNKKEVAEILGVCPSTIYHNRRLFPHSKWTVADIARVAMKL